MTSLHKPENVAQIIVKKEAWPLSPEDLRILAKRPVAEFKTDSNVVMDDFRSAILEAADVIERLNAELALYRDVAEASSLHDCPVDTMLVMDCRICSALTALHAFQAKREAGE